MTSPVRPLIFLPANLAGTKIGGIQSFVKGFIKFAPADFEIECIGTTSDRSALPLANWRMLEVEGRPVRYLAVATTRPSDVRERVPIALRYTLGLVRYRRSIRTHGRILNFHRAGVPLAVIGSPAPKVQYVHLNVADIYRERGESRWRRLPGAYHRVEDLTIPHMARVWVVNERGVQFYRERHPSIADRFRFLPTWYDGSIFGQRTETDRDEARVQVLAQFGLDREVRLLLFVGRLEAQKDPELLIEAFACARQRDQRLFLVIVGAGGLERAAKNRVRALGVADAVQFVGPRSRHAVARMMLASDALVLVSRFEGMPITVIEALASGLPVVATNVGEVPRLVKNGTTGWLVEDRTPEAIADGIGRVLGLHPQRVARSCVAVASSYEASAVLRPVYEYHRQLAEMIEPRPHRPASSLSDQKNA